MRSISTDSLTTLAQRLGNEPISILEIEWSPGKKSQYADRDVGSIPGKIVELGQLDDALSTDYIGNSQQVSVTLDDVDGSLKHIFDSADIHKLPVRLYQWFTGLPLSDKFLVFAGRINTPISWSERDRTVKLTALSRIEDREIGFSAEEGNFPYVPSNMIGKAWPMVFGTVYDYPALRISFAVEGTTLTGVGILSGQTEFLASPLYENGTNVDRNKLNQLALEAVHVWVLNEAALAWADISDYATRDRLIGQANDIQEKMAGEIARMRAQESCAQGRRAQQIAEANSKGLGANPIRILGGEDFPQNREVTIDIKGALFTGRFEGELFHIRDRQNPIDQAALDEMRANLALPLGSDPLAYDPCPQLAVAQKYDFKVNVPVTFANPEGIMEAQGFLLPSAPSASQSPSGEQILQQFWADAGSKVLLYTDPSVTYVASIVPGRVLAVKAYQTLDGVRRLTLVPNDYYTVETKSYGTLTAVQIKVKRPLSTVWYRDTNNTLIRGWSDEIYVTFESDVGPDIVDILAYIIDNYTDLTYDTESFEHVRTKLAPFPANFPILERKNVLTVLKEIAFQSRCAFWLEDNVIHLKYLPEEPAAVDTITVSDIDADEGIEVSLTDTESLVTKMVVRWHLGFAPSEYAPSSGDTTQYMILRHNVAKYGVHEQEYEWYIFNQPDIILKCATFWLNRLSNTWKRVRFRTFLNKLPLQAFDAVTLNVPQAASPVKAVVTRAAYNSAENCIDFECDLPVRAGKMTQDPYYWPAALPKTTTWPPADETTDTGITGELPVGIVDHIIATGTVFVGGPNVVYLAQSTRGDRTLTDVGFVAQTALAARYFSGVQASSRPSLNLRNYRLRESDPITIPEDPKPLVIDLATTKIIDSSQEVASLYGYLREVLCLGSDRDVLLDLTRAQVRNPQKGQTGRLDEVLALNDEGQLGVHWTVSVMDTGAGETGKLSDMIYVKNSHVMLDGYVSIVTGDTPDGAVFDFKYDSDGAVLGAGTAFLKD